MFFEIPNICNILVNQYGVVLNGKTGNILKPYSDKQGYMYVKVHYKGGYKHVAIHRAVAMVFCAGYFDGAVVDHIDGNKQNNYYKNLRWCTQKENLEYGYERRNDDAVRNCESCYLYYEENKIGKFRSVREAVRFAEKEYESSYSMLCKHHNHKRVKIRKCND